MKIEFYHLKFQLEQLQNTYYDASEDVGNMQRARAFWRTRERALAAEQLPDQGGSAWGPAHSERSELHHHAQELEARIKALQENKPMPIEADGPPSAGSFASATSAAPKETISAAATQRPRRRHAAEDAVVPPPGLPAPMQDYDDYVQQPYLRERQFIPLTTTAVRDHEAPRVQGPPSSSSSNSSCTPSRSRKRKKVKKKEKKQKKVAHSREKTPTPYRVKSTELRLGSWPTAVGFPAWRRALRIAVVGASTRPEKAKPWVFEGGEDDRTLADFASHEHDRLRALDAKLADALLKIVKGEPARRIAIEADQAALATDLLSGRQLLHMIYAKFRRDETRTDTAAYTNLENLRCGTSDASLASFVNLWDNLMLTFITPLTPDHMFTAFYSRAIHPPSLAHTVAHINRIPHGHPDENFAFISMTVRAHIEQARSDKEPAEVAKVPCGGGAPDVALPAASPEEKKNMPCFAVMDGKTCAAGASCPYVLPQAGHHCRCQGENEGEGEGKGQGQGAASSCSA